MGQGVKIMDTDKRLLLQKITNQPIAEMHYLPGGCVGEVWKVQFENGDCVVAKTSAHGDHLHIEGQMLQYLKDNSHLPVPAVLLAQTDFLVIEFIATENPKESSATQLAHHIANLHNVTDDYFGFANDTLIGPLLQPNKQSDSWIDFFSQQRLLYMAQQACDSGAVSIKFCTSLEKLCNQLHNYISEPKQKSLLHGDLWSGNILYTKECNVAFIDPAIYYGDGEIEIAYSQMFGGIDDNFIYQYNNLRPLSDNFYTERMPIYHLYPLLVHARLFGGNYGIQAIKIVKKFL